MLSSYVHVSVTTNEDGLVSDLLPCTGIAMSHEELVQSSVIAVSFANYEREYCKTSNQWLPRFASDGQPEHIMTFGNGL